jgi:hypothetical protein
MTKLTKCQNHDHRGGVFDTWTEWAKPRLKGPKGWPVGQTPWPADQVSCRFGPQLRGHVPTGGVEGQGGGGRSTQPAGEVAWLAGHHLVPNRLLRVGGAPPRTYKYPPTVEMRRHQISEIPLAKLSFLV